jgi:hypothetical protein
MFDGRHLSLGRRAGDGTDDETPGSTEPGPEEASREEASREEAGPEEVRSEEEIGDVIHPAMRFARMSAR